MEFVINCEKNWTIDGLMFSQYGSLRFNELRPMAFKENFVQNVQNSSYGG